jgi:hypothetical protein
MVLASPTHAPRELHPADSTTETTTPTSTHVRTQSRSTDIDQHTLRLGHLHRHGICRTSLRVLLLLLLPVLRLLSVLVLLAYREGLQAHAEV